MPRATCSSDVFNAIAEARRRDILVYLAGTERQESAKHASELVPALEQSVTTAKQILIAMDARRSRKTWRAIDGDREVMAIPVRALLRSIMLNYGRAPTRIRLRRPHDRPCRSDTREGQIVFFLRNVHYLQQMPRDKSASNGAEFGPTGAFENFLRKVRGLSQDRGKHCRVASRRRKNTSRALVSLGRRRGIRQLVASEDHI